MVVQRVVDGDSLQVKRAGIFSFLRRSFPVRLYAIDAPELAQPFGQESRQALESLVKRGRVRMEEVSEDRYGRRVGLLYRSQRGREEMINVAMVRSGMAYWYRRYGGRELGFPEAEARARSRRLGVWSGERRQRPWHYRAQGRRRERRRVRVVWIAIGSFILAAAVALGVAVASTMWA